MIYRYVTYPSGKIERRQTSHSNIFSALNFIGIRKEIMRGTKLIAISYEDSELNIGWAGLPVAKRLTLAELTMLRLQAIVV